MANILETARAEHQYYTLVRGIESLAGLVDTLNGPGPFTIFVPSDAAFDRLSSDQQANPFADPEKLARVLTYHDPGQHHGRQRHHARHRQSAGPCIHSALTPGSTLLVQRIGESVMFKLDESLEICLRAVASRYPGSLVEINQDLLDRSDLWEGLCPVEQVLDQLHVHAPQLLHVPARVLIDDDQAISAIYLLDRSQEVPALYLYSNHSAGGAYRQELHEPVITLESDDSDLEQPQRRQQELQ